MNLSCCIWSLPGPEPENLSHIAELGYTWIDIQPHMLAGDRRVLARELGLAVSCVGAAFGMPAGASLDGAEPDAVRPALDHLDRSFSRAASLGATVAYVIPGTDTSPNALNRYAESINKAAEMAAGAGLKLCIEHFPGRALPTAEDTLNFIKNISHPNLYLLYDSGHVQMSNEPPATTIKQAGSLLGYVHFDDNDGEADLHWALLDGVMTEASLRETFAALEEIGYNGSVSLELNQTLPDPLDVLTRSTKIINAIGGRYWQ